MQTTQGRRRAVAGLFLAAAMPHAIAQTAKPVTSQPHRFRGVSPTEIIIGQSLSLQEGKNPYAAAALQGIQLAFDGINASGGVRGRKLVLRTLDDNAKGDVAEANARKLIDEGAFLLFAALEGGPSLGVAKVAQERGVVFFGAMAGAPGLWKPHRPMVFPLRASHQAEYRKLLDLSAVVGWKRVGFLHAATDTGRAHLANVKLECENVGANFVADLPYKQEMNDEELDVLVQAARQGNANIVIYHGNPKLFERFVLRSHRIGYRPQFMGVNSGASEVAKRLSADGLGIVFAQVVPSPGTQKFAVTREFARAWSDKHGGAKPSSHGSLEGFLTGKALALALRRAGPALTTDALIEALYRGPLDIGGMVARYARGDHVGLGYVELSAVGREGRFVY